MERIKKLINAKFIRQANAYHSRETLQAIRSNSPKKQNIPLSQILTDKLRASIFIFFLLGITCSIGAQTEENVFEWQANNEIAAKNEFLPLYRGKYSNDPTYVYKEYDVSINNQDSHKLKIKGFDKTMSKTFDAFEIYHNGKRILEYFSSDLLYDVRYITVKASEAYYLKVPLSDDSFALLFGGWLFGSGDETTEMIIAVVSGDKAKVVFDDYAYAYKYTPGENFAIEYVDDINGLYDNDPIVFTESFLKTRTKHKIWKEGNMLKYKSWK